MDEKESGKAAAITDGDSIAPSSSRSSRWNDGIAEKNRAAGETRAAEDRMSS